MDAAGLHVLHLCLSSGSDAVSLSSTVPSLNASSASGTTDGPGTDKRLGLSPMDIPELSPYVPGGMSTYLAQYPSQLIPSLP